MSGKESAMSATQMSFREFGRMWPELTAEQKIYYLTLAGVCTQVSPSEYTSFPWSDLGEWRETIYLAYAKEFTEKRQARKNQKDGCLDPNYYRMEPVE